MIKTPAADTTAVVTVVKDGNGKITDAKATIEKKIAGNNKLSVPGTVVKQITEAAGTKDVLITVVAKDAKGKTKFTVLVKADDLVAGKKLKIYQYNAKTDAYIMVNSKTYTVGKDGTVSVTMTKNKTYKLVTTAEAKKINKKITKNLKLSKSSITIKRGKTATVKISKKFNKSNIKKVKYSSTKKSVVTVSKKGKVKGKNKGSAKVKVKVTLKNGTKKTLTAKVKVK